MDGIEWIAEDSISFRPPLSPERFQTILDTMGGVANGEELDVQELKEMTLTPPSPLQATF